MDDQRLREMNALSHYVELMRLVEAVRRLGWSRLARGQAARLDLRLAAWLGGRMVRWGADLARYGCAPAGAGPVRAARGG
ncbi:MAG TPA: hypothetical protein VG370_25680 [Chloroflexota bacterium]|nr:hypothetical protein [Chloroflexota bacterium]